MIAEMVARRVLDGDLARLQGLLARGDRADVAEGRRVVAKLRTALAARPPESSDPGQVALELRYSGETVVRDCPLGCPLAAVVCVARQIQSEIEVGRGPAVRRSSPAKRGRTPTRPTCVTARCEVGARVRLLLGDVTQAREMARRAPRARDTSEG